jgi:hypothetical protein
MHRFGRMALFIKRGESLLRGGMSRATLIFLLFKKLIARVIFLLAVISFSGSWVVLTLDVRCCVGRLTRPRYL